MKNKLLKLSFIISIIGIFLLIIISQQIKPIEINNYSELTNFKLNQYVQTTGKIISIRNYDDFSIIKLNNNITLTCNNCNFQLNQTIKVTGKLTQYNSELQIQAEIIS